jgi:hypothetical protein
LEALVRHPDDDEADARPGVEPLVHQPKLGRARREPAEAKGGAERGDVVLGHGSSSHNAATALMSAPHCKGEVLRQTIHNLNALATG